MTAVVSWNGLWNGTKSAKKNLTSLFNEKRSIINISISTHSSLNYNNNNNNNDSVPQEWL